MLPLCGPGALARSVAQHLVGSGGAPQGMSQKAEKATSAAASVRPTPLGPAPRWGSAKARSTGADKRIAHAGRAEIT